MSIFNIPKESSSAKKTEQFEKKADPEKAPVEKKEPDLSLLKGRYAVDANAPSTRDWLENRQNFNGIKWLDGFADTKKRENIWKELTKGMGPNIDKKELEKKLQDLRDAWKHAKTFEERKKIKANWELISRARGQDLLPGHLKNLF